jgi:hypothetical protein
MLCRRWDLGWFHKPQSGPAAWRTCGSEAERPNPPPPPLPSPPNPRACRRDCGGRVRQLPDQRGCSARQDQGGGAPAGADRANSCLRSTGGPYPEPRTSSPAPAAHTHAFSRPLHVCRMWWRCWTRACTTWLAWLRAAGWMASGGRGTQGAWRMSMSKLNWSGVRQVRQGRQAPALGTPRMCLGAALLVLVRVATGSAMGCAADTRMRCLPM